MAIDPAQILRQSFTTQADAMRAMELASSQTQSAAAAQETGTLMGSQVVVESDPLAELMDSMEELSFQFEEKEMKKVGERKMGEAQGPRMAYVRAIEKWVSLFSDMPSSAFIASLLRKIRLMMGGGQQLDARGLLRELARGSTDPSHQFAMLDILEQALGGNEADVRELLRQAKSQLQLERGAEIRAGINLAEEVNARATSPAEMQDLREMYRSEVVGFTTPHDCFRSLLAARGPGGIADAIAFLISGCGKDMASAFPSLSEEALSRILTDLQCVQVLTTVMEKLSGLAGRMAKEFGDSCLLNGEQLTGRVLDFTEETFVSSGMIAAFVGECGMRKFLAKMDFTRELTKLFRQLSPRLFKKESDRLQLVDATQEHLDDLISQENDGIDPDEESPSDRSDYAANDKTIKPSNHQTTKPLNHPMSERRTA